jgi:hypothetical protein
VSLHDDHPCRRRNRDRTTPGRGAFSPDRARGLLRDGQPRRVCLRPHLGACGPDAQGRTRARALDTGTTVQRTTKAGRAWPYRLEMRIGEGTVACVHYGRRSDGEFEYIADPTARDLDLLFGSIAAAGSRLLSRLPALRPLLQRPTLLEPGLTRLSRSRRSPRADPGRITNRWHRRLACHGLVRRLRVDRRLRGLRLSSARLIRRTSITRE